MPTPPVATPCPLAATGTYRLRTSAPTFEPATTAPHFYALQVRHDTLNLTLATPTLSQQVTVTATGTPTPLAQSGAAITLLDQTQYQQSPELQQPFRLVPGLQLTQTGQTGGTTTASSSAAARTRPTTRSCSMACRSTTWAAGSTSPIYATIGIAQIEVLRQPNSALYGSDALAGVVQFTTTRGTTPLPLLTYAVDGGNLGTLPAGVLELSGAHARFDYYNGFARLDTRNSLPDDQFHNVHLRRQLRLAPDTRTDLRFTFRHLSTNSGTPNALTLYGIPDFANSFEHDTILSATAQRQTTAQLAQPHPLRPRGASFQLHPVRPRRHPLHHPRHARRLRPKRLPRQPGHHHRRQRLHRLRPGSPRLPRRIPQLVRTTANRDFVYGQTDYRFNLHTTLLGAFKYDAERGTNNILPVVPGSLSSIDRRNQSYTLQLAGDFRNRFFYTLGSGIEHNQLYGNALTPRVSLALLRRPPQRPAAASPAPSCTRASAKASRTRASASKSTLSTDLKTPPRVPPLSSIQHQPIGAEYSRTYDAGIEQQFGDGRARLNVTYFHNEFTNGIQFLLANRAHRRRRHPRRSRQRSRISAPTSTRRRTARMGVEFESEFRLARHLFARAGYTYLDAVVQRSFPSDALFPSLNTSCKFLDYPSSACIPSARRLPSRSGIAPHSGYFALALHTQQPLRRAPSTGTLVGRRDDSTFLYDKDFGTTLLLPNRNLDGAYQRLELSASYQVRHNVSTYVDMQNLLNENYAEAFGFPSLPFNIRGGVKFSFGGESFGIK